MIKKKIYPPTYFNFTIVLMVSLHFFMPIYQIFHDCWILFGIIPLIAGVIMNLLADKAIKLHKKTVKPYEESDFLVTEGVFDISRNPMYFGMILIHFGIAIFLGSLSPYIAILFFTYLINKNFIKTEEKMLSEKFGDGWLDYRKKPRKWI